MTISKMSEQEYLDRLSGLFEKVKAEIHTEDESILSDRYRDAEFDLTVEYRLGADFSRERWERLRKIHQQSHNNTETIKAKYLSGNLSKKDFAAQMHLANERMVDAFKKVLTPAEFRAFFGPEDGDFQLALSPDAL